MAETQLDHKLALQDTVPGSSASLYESQKLGQETTGNEAQLVGANGDILLIPRPSEDPADPLNWHPVRKWLILAFLVLWSAVALSLQNVLNNYLPTLQNRYNDHSASDINLLSTIITPMVAPGELIFVPLAIAYGRRFSLLLSIVLLVASCFWAAYTTSYTSMLIARIFQGIAGGPTDAMAITIVQEFTFVHQRGVMLGALLMGQLALSLLFAIMVTYMAVSLGIQWSFVLFGAVAVFSLAAIFLVMPETQYERKVNPSDPPLFVNQHAEFRRAIQGNAQYPPYTMSRKLRFWKAPTTTGDASVSEFFIQMGHCCMSPSIWWNALLNGITTGCLIAFSVTYASMLVSPPWSWPSENVGLINIASCVGAGFNWLITGYGNDKVLIYLAKRNQGVTKPQHRLLVLVIPITLGIVVNISFGVLAQRYLITSPGGSQPHWFSLCFMMGVYYVFFGGVMESTYTYLANTTTPEKSLAAMTVVSVVRDMISFGLSYGVTSFSGNCGYLISFGVYTALIVVFGFLAIPVYLTTRKS